MRRRLIARAPAAGSAAPRGLTLLELVIAVLVLSLGTVAALRAIDQGRHVLGGAMPRLMAQIAAQNRAEELRLLGLAGAAQLPATRRLGGQDITLTLQPEATAGGVIRARITATSAAGPGAVLVTYLPPERPR